MKRSDGWYCYVWWLNPFLIAMWLFQTILVWIRMICKWSKLAFSILINLRCKFACINFSELYNNPYLPTFHHQSEHVQKTWPASRHFSSQVTPQLDESSRDVHCQQAIKSPSPQRPSPGVLQVALLSQPDTGTVVKTTNCRNSQVSIFC